MGDICETVAGASPKDSLCARLAGRESHLCRLHRRTSMSLRLPRGAKSCLNSLFSRVSMTSSSGTDLALVSFGLIFAVRAVLSKAFSSLAEQMLVSCLWRRSARPSVFLTDPDCVRMASCPAGTSASWVLWSWGGHKARSWPASCQQKPVAGSWGGRPALLPFAFLPSGLECRLRLCLQNGTRSHGPGSH